MVREYGTQITPHLYRVAWWEMAGQGVVNCDTYAIDCGEQVVLIDSGRGGASYPMMKENLKYWGLWDRLSICLLTHMHRDHTGGVSQLQADGVSVWAGHGAAACAHDERAIAYFAGDVPRLDRVLDDGERIAVGENEFEVLYTPGHTSSCVSYLVTIDSIRCAFTGDLVMPNGNIGYSGSFDFGSSQLIASLRRLLQREFDAVLTGHMLSSTQSGFWLRDGRHHVKETLDAGHEGQWKTS